MAERRIEVSHEAVRCRVTKFGRESPQACLKLKRPRWGIGTSVM